jgi:uncharacterized integral membrane protein (TIGR00698 family)
MTFRDRLGEAALGSGLLVCLIAPIPPAAALTLGGLIAIAISNRHAARARRWATPLLQAGVVGLGATMDLRVIARVGLHGLLYTIVGIAAALTVGTWLGRLLGVRRQSALLVSLGTAICGGSAILAVAPVMKASSEDTSVSLATVFLLNGVALFVFPVVGHALHLSQTSFGLWAALAIHDTSSVVGAALAFGPAALATATTVKLARALWIAPTTALLAWREGHGHAQVPLFIIGFVVAAALGTFVAPVRALAPAMTAVARHLLVAALLLIGAGLSPAALRRTGARTLVHGAVLWAIVAAATLAAIWRGWIA